MTALLPDAAPVADVPLDRLAAELDGRLLLLGDPEHTAVWFGEAAGLIHSIEPAATIVADTVRQALQALRAGGAAAA